MYEKAQLRSDFRKKKSPWLGLEAKKVITLEQVIISRKEACYIKFVLGRLVGGAFCERNSDWNFRRILMPSAQLT